VPWAHEHNSCCLRVLEGKKPAGKPSDKADEHLGFNDRVGAIVTHDVESAMFGTSLGVDLRTGEQVEGGLDTVGKRCNGHA